MAAVLDLDLVTVVKRRADITAPGGCFRQRSERVQGGERAGRGLKFLGFPRTRERISWKSSVSS